MGFKSLAQTRPTAKCRLARTLGVSNSDLCPPPVLVKRGDMAKVATNLWRAVHTDQYPDGPIKDEEPLPGVLYPTFERTQIGTLPSGKPKYRDPDIQITDGKVPRGAGTSLYDKENFFRGKSWRYLRIPKDTDIDPNLVVTGPVWNEYIGANHYQIEAIKPMFPEVYRGALDNFARAAVKKAYEDARR